MSERKLITKFRDCLEYHCDFPVPGVNFIDIFPLVSKHLNQVADEFISQIAASKFNFFGKEDSYIAGIESRGFILASSIAARSNVKFIPIRKAGKLPGKVVSQAITLEYSEAIIEMQEGKGDVVLVDDVLATGGTMRGAKKLAELAGYNVRALATLVNIKKLNDLGDVISILDE